MKANPARYLSTLAAVVAVVAAVLYQVERDGATPQPASLRYEPRWPKFDTSGFRLISRGSPSWGADASLEKIAEIWTQPGYRFLESLDKLLAERNLSEYDRIQSLVTKATMFLAEGEARQAYLILAEARSQADADHQLTQIYRFPLVFLQGLTALRIGENENCILCRGESSCILPIAPAAVHVKPEGSRLAIAHFREYLRRFPDDLEVRWLLNLAHMTLGEYPDQVDPEFLVRLDRWLHSEFDIGKFRDVGHLVGVNRFNQAGGAIMDDFDNDGRLDLVVTTMDPTEPMGFYRNRGDGTFEECAAKAGLKGQLGGINCIQGDFNNDGWLDIFVCRGGWLWDPIRPSLLRNNGDGTFTDITPKHGLGDPQCAHGAAWADYDNDGQLDLFVCNERRPNRLYHNKGDGTFEEVAARAGVAGNAEFCKAVNWIDFDNDDYPDLFVTDLVGLPHLFHNNRNGTFSDVTESMGTVGPEKGYTCWAWDFDNDGWLDILAICYELPTAEVLKGMIGQPTTKGIGRLYRNLRGKRFQDMTREAGLEASFLCMGSNFGDFDNDGYLDFYLGTGAPSFESLVPNRMFKNVAGKRFSEITASAGTGHLQKGHGVCCGDWDRDGDIDVFIEMGGSINGDKYHNALFQNPGQGNHWLTVKLVGKKTNRSAIGARIKAVAAGKEPLTVCRHVSSGSSFGGNPLQQTLGLGQAERVARLEIHWPTSGTTQIFYDVAVDQAIEITEFEQGYRRLNWSTIPLPK